MVLRVLVFAFVMLIVLLCVFVVRGSEHPGGPSYFFVVIGTLSLIVGLVVAQVWLGPVAVAGSSSALPSFYDYHQKMLIALALMEFCALVGVFMSGDVTTSYLMAGGSIAAIVLGVYPHVERYCRAISGQ